MLSKPYKYLLFFLLIFLVYWPTLQNQFAWDDALVLTENKLTQEGVGAIPQIFKERKYIAGRSLYRPVAQSFFTLQWSFFKDNPKGYHFVSLFLYGLLCAMLFFALNQFFKSQPVWLLFAITALFALHPAHVEVVANIKSQDEMLAVLFFILTFLLANKSKKIWFSFLGMLIFAVLSIYSKPSAISILPFIFVWFFYKNKVFFQEKIIIVKNKVLRYPQLSFSVLSFVLCLVIYFSIHSFRFTLPIFLLLVLIINRLNKTKWEMVFNSLACFILILINKEYSNLVLLLHFVWLINALRNQKTIHKPYVYIIQHLFLISLVIWANNLDLLVAIAIFSGVVYLLATLQTNKKYLLFVFPLALLVMPLVFFDVTIMSAIVLFALALLLTLIGYFVLSHKLWLLLVLGLITLNTFLYIDYSTISDYYSARPLEQSMENAMPNSNERAFVSNAPYHNILVGVDDFATKTATICRIQLLYLKKLVYPHPLVHQHGVWQVQLASWKDWDVYLSIFLHTALIALMILAYKRKWWLIAAGIAWYFVSISIYTNIIKLMPDTMAERFLFLPSIGFCMAFVAGVYRLFSFIIKNENQQKIAMGFFFLPMLLAFSYKNYDRSKDWKNNLTLAQNTIPYAQNNAAINAQYALELNRINDSITNPAKRDSIDELIVKHYSKSIDLYPDFFGANYDLGFFYIQKGKPQLAKPLLEKAASLDTFRTEPHYYLGFIYYEDKDYQKSVNAFNRVLNGNKQAHSETELTNAILFMSRSYFNLNKLKAAEKALLFGSERYPKNPEFFKLLGNIYFQTEDYKNALNTFQKLEVLMPNDALLQNTIAICKEKLKQL